MTNVSAKVRLYGFLLMLASIAAVCVARGGWALFGLFLVAVAARLVLDAAEARNAQRVARWLRKYLFVWFLAALLLMALADTLTQILRAGWLAGVIHSVAWAGACLVILTRVGSAATMSFYWLSLGILIGAAFLPKNAFYLPFLMLHALISLKFLALAGWGDAVFAFGNFLRGGGAASPVGRDGASGRGLGARDGKGSRLRGWFPAPHEDSLSEIVLFGFILFLSGVLFVMIPRPGLLSQLGKGGQEAVASGEGGVREVVHETVGTDEWTTAGFTGGIDLRGRGPDVSDRTIVMGVEVRTDERHSSEVLRQPLRLRGMTLDRYVDGRWVTTGPRFMARDGDDGVGDGWTEVTSPAGQGSRGTVWQRVRVSGGRSRYIFAVPNLWRVRLPEVFIDQRGGAYPAEAGGQTLYEVESLLPGVSPGEEASLEGEEVPAGYVEVPPDFEEVRDLAQSWTWREPSAWGKALSVRTKLERGYVYTTEVSYGPVGDPIKRFLLSERRGYCAQFAGAMAMVLRCLGIPSRVGVGYLTDEVSPDGQYVVRNSHAHAWVEAYIGGMGWVVLDPSPTGSGVDELEGTAGAIALTGVEGEGASLGWQDAVWDFGPDWQAGVLGGIAGLASAFGCFAWGIISSPVFLGILGVVVAVAICSLIFVPREKREEVLERIIRRGAPERLGFYDELLRILSAKGLRKLRTQTGMEFAEGVGEKIPPLRSPVVEVMELYYSARYGGRPPVKERLERAWALMHSVREFGT